MTFGSLFAGIGGFDLGLERAGMTCRWQVEIDPFCRQVLAKHWPHVKRYEDVRTLHGYVAHTETDRCGSGWSGGSAGEGARLSDAPQRDGCPTCLPPVDLLCGGFPCQPHSLAGKRGGSTDTRDLWGEFARLIRQIRPRWVLAENVPGLLSTESGRFFGRVLGDLAQSGYDAEWDCIPASAVGAPHRRDRVWIVAYADRQRGCSRIAHGKNAEDVRQPSEHPMADARDQRLEERALSEGQERQAVSDAVGCSQWVFSNTDIEPLGWLAESRGQRGEWIVEPDVGRVAHGVPARVDRLRSLGNAIVPQVACWLGERLKVMDAQRYPA